MQPWSLAHTDVSTAHPRPSTACPSLMSRSPGRVAGALLRLAKLRQGCATTAFAFATLQFWGQGLENMFIVFAAVFSFGKPLPAALGQALLNSLASQGIYDPSSECWMHSQGHFLL